MLFLFIFLSVWVGPNIWYVSDDGSDDNDCHSESAPCRNLQIVLNRATDGADIYVTSDTLSLSGAQVKNAISKPEQEDVCLLMSNISYSLSSVSNKLVKVTCSGRWD